MSGRGGYDVAVVGLGAVGSAALRSLARRGARAVGIDRFRPPHDRGSSHGESRITRQAIGEGENYVPLVLRSNALLEGLEAETGERLLDRCGFLYLTRDDYGTAHHGKSGFMARTQAAAQRFDIEHEMLDADEVRRRFAQFTALHGDEHAYFEPGGGYLRPEAIIAAQLKLARRDGATLLTDCRVLGAEIEAAGVKVQTDTGEIEADHVIWATGAWLPRMGGARVASHVAVHRQTLHWFDLIDPSSYRVGATPTFIWTHGLTTAEQFYGFPPIDGRIKVAREQYDGACDPDEDVRAPDPSDAVDMAERHVRGRLAGVRDLPTRSAVCHYAVTPDADFVIERGDRAQLISACSGHGFKHAPAIGEAVAAAAIGAAMEVDLTSFSAARFEATG